jgi:Ca-activated chloride channel family protein
LLGDANPLLRIMIPTFTYPWALLLLLLVPLVIWRHMRQSGGAWKYSDHRILPTLPGWRARFAEWGGLSLRLGVLLATIIALSGPRWVDESSRIPTEGISIAMILDVSVSMENQDFAWGNTTTSRLEGVKKVFRLFVAGGQSPDGVELNGRPNDLIALVTFATHPHTACPLTLEHKALLEIMEKQTPRTGPNEGTTNPGDAIAWALHVLQQAPTKRKVIVFLTDGEANVDKTLKPKQSAQLAANLSIPIYAIDASPTPKNKQDAEEIERGRATMQAIAAMTEGSYFRAQDVRGLSQAYENIDRIERERIRSFQYRRYYEGFPWFALAALACGLTLITLESTWWRRTP